MKWIFTLCCFLSLCTYAQVPRKSQISLIGGYSLASSFHPQINVMSGSHEIEVVKNDSRSLEFFNERGKQIDMESMLGRDMTLGIQYRYTNPKTDKGFFMDVQANAQQNVTDFTLPRNISFGVSCTPSLRRALRSQGVSASIGRFWGNGFFVRMGGRLSTNFKNNRDNLFGDVATQRPYYFVSDGFGSLQNGSGAIITTHSHIAMNWSVIPEIGCKGNEDQFYWEVGLSCHLPVSGSSVYHETYKFYKNRYNVGENQVHYSNGGLFITARIGWNLLSATKRQRTYVSRPSKPNPSFQPKIYEPRPSPGNSRFDKVTTNQTLRLNVLFELTKSKILRSSFAELDEVSQWMLSHPTVEITLEGHTDKIGDSDLNYELSIQRVDAVKSYLVNKGVFNHRINAIGYGDTRLLCPSPCERNRRVEMIITKR